MQLKGESLREELGNEAYEVFQELKKLSMQQGVQARLLYDVRLK